MPKTSSHRTAAKKARQQPETLRLSSLSPSLTVNDLQRSIRWYRDVVGFHISEDWKDGDTVIGVRLRAGSAEVVLNQDDFAKGRDRKKGEGFRVYCYTRQSVDELAANIRVRGGTMTREPTDQPWGSREFDLVDPDGYRITIAHRA